MTTDVYHKTKNKAFEFLRKKYIAAFMTSRLINKTGPDFVVLDEPVTLVYLNHEMNPEVLGMVDVLRDQGFRVILAETLAGLERDLA